MFGLVIDARLIVMVMIGAAVFAGVQGLSGLLTVATQKRKLNQRLQVGERINGISDLVVELRKRRGLTATGGRAERLRWLSDMIIASGRAFSCGRLGAQAAHTAASSSMDVARQQKRCKPA